VINNFNAEPLFMEEYTLYYEDEDEDYPRETEQER
jgi:hypothetical protein